MYDESLPKPTKMPDLHEFMGNPEMRNREYCVLCNLPRSNRAHLSRGF